MKQPGIRVLQGEDLLAQIVPHRVQAHPHRLLLEGAQRKESRERADRQSEGQDWRTRDPSGHEDHERDTADSRHHPRVAGPERTEAGQAVDGQRGPDYGGRREGSHQEVGGRDGDGPPSLLDGHTQAGDGHSRDQPDHDSRLRPPHKQGQ